MNQKQQNRLSMNKAVADLLFFRQSVWAGLPSFAAAADRLKNTIGLLDQALQRQSAVDTTGAAADKANAGAAAIKRVMLLAHNAAAYALAHNKMELYQHVNHSRSYLDRLNDNELPNTLQGMLDKVGEQAAFLGEYNVTPQKIAEAQAAINEVAAILTRPRTLTDEHSTATASIPVLEKEVRRLLAMLDKLIRNFEDDAPELLSDYEHARIIVDRGIRHEKPKDDPEKDGDKKDEDDPTGK